MEKGKRIEAISGEFQLPEAIIQHIQSFLSGKEAALTSVLSKSWYSVWLTRPHLDFDQRNFQSRGHGDPTSRITDEFLEFAKKTMKRYEESNLKIERLKLFITEMDSYALANELTVKALKMSASDLDLEFLSLNETFVLPHEVFGSENLVRLSAAGCQIDRGENGKLSCWRLKSLSLCRVHIENDIIWDMALRCPLMEKLSLHNCECLFKVQSPNPVPPRSRMLALNPSIEFLKQNVETDTDSPVNQYEFHNLKCLFLEKVKIDTLFFRGSSSIFPSLTDLTFHHCIGYRGIQIHSRSLERISFVQDRILRAKFDVPSIRKFTFSGSELPNLSFETTSKKWESVISIKCSRHRLSTSWFCKLKKLSDKD